MHILDYIYTMYLFWSIYLDINLKILSVKGNMLVSPADWNSFREFHSTFVYSHSYMLASQVILERTGAVTNDGLEETTWYCWWHMPCNMFGLIPFISLNVPFICSTKIRKNQDTMECTTLLPDSGDLLGSYVTISMIFAFVVNFAYGWGPIVPCQLGRRREMELGGVTTWLTWWWGYDTLKWLLRYTWLKKQRSKPQKNRRKSACKHLSFRQTYVAFHEKHWDAAKIQKYYEMPHPTDVDSP